MNDTKGFVCSVAIAMQMRVLNALFEQLRPVSLITKNITRFLLFLKIFKPLKNLVAFKKARPILDFWGTQPVQKCSVWSHNSLLMLLTVFLIRYGVR